MIFFLFFFWSSYHFSFMTNILPWLCAGSEAACSSPCCRGRSPLGAVPFSKLSLDPQAAWPGIFFLLSASLNLCKAVK